MKNLSADLDLTKDWIQSVFYISNDKLEELLYLALA